MPGLGGQCSWESPGLRVPHPTGQGSPQSAFIIFLFPWLHRKPRIYLLVLHLFALKGRPGCAAPWGLRKEEAVLLDWGVQKTKGPALHFEPGEVAAGPRSAPGSPAPLGASTSPVGPHGAEPTMLALVLGGGGWQILHLAGDLPGKNLSP